MFECDRQLLQEAMKYVKNQRVRCRFGCVWLFGIIDIVKDNNYYNVSYGSRKQFEKHQFGYPLNFFADFHESELKPFKL